MGESRTELIAWLNDLLGLGLTKVEQCGTGAAYCQIIDSIYGNVPMSKINWQAKHEYEFLTNFKVLQDTFNRNKISKPIPVERLVKCKMQDNLEWLQWSKKFWDTNFPGGEYDAEGRRHGAAAVPPPLHGQATVGAARLSGARPPATRAPAARVSNATAAPVRRAAAAPRAGNGVSRPVGVSRAAQQQHEEDAAAVAALSAEVEDMRANLETIEKERDFYFDKLREIEIIVSDRFAVAESHASAVAEGRETEVADLIPPSETELGILEQIRTIMYATDDGFSVPTEPPVDEEEMF